MRNHQRKEDGTKEGNHGGGALEFKKPSSERRKPPRPGRETQMKTGEKLIQKPKDKLRTLWQKQKMKHRMDGMERWEQGKERR